MKLTTRQHGSAKRTRTPQQTTHNLRNPYTSPHHIPPQSTLSNQNISIMDNIITFI
jgi:hypothetical protein